MSGPEDESTGQEGPTQQQDAGPGDISGDAHKAPSSDAGENGALAHTDLVNPDGSPSQSEEAGLSGLSTPSSGEVAFDSPESGPAETDDMTETTAASDVDDCLENGHNTAGERPSGDTAPASSKCSSVAERLLVAISADEDDDADPPSADADRDIVETAHGTLGEPSPTSTTTSSAQALGNDDDMPDLEEAHHDLQSPPEEHTQALGENAVAPADAETAQDGPQSPTTAPEASGREDAPEGPYEDSPSTVCLRDMSDKSDARQQWILRKEEDRKDVDALDQLMLMYGFEEVKAHFLSVYDEARAVRKRGDDLQETKNLDICFVEGSESDRTQVTELYISLLQNLALVSADVVARTKPYQDMSEVWENATVDGKRRILHVDDPEWPYWSPLRSVLATHFEETTDCKPPVIVLHSAYEVEDYILQPTEKVPAMRIVPLRRTSDDLLAMFLGEMKKECEGKDVEGGWDGAPFQTLVSRLTAKGGLESSDSVLQWVRGVKERREKRIEAEKAGRAPRAPDKTLLHFTKSDLLGLSAAERGYQSAAWAELQRMIGMEDVKESVREFLSHAALSERLEMEGKPTLGTWSNCRCFIGPPGTGKTTAANLYARILKELDLLDNDIIVEKRASDLIGCYVGWSEEATKKAIDKASGGVLIIDDFHLLLPDSMHNTDKNDVFRAAVIDTIVANIDPNSQRREAVILIGYPESMTEAFEKSNPGLARRFPLRQSFRFRPYNDAELAQILQLKLREHDMVASDTAIRVAEEMLSIARHRPNFGNGGDVENLLRAAQAARNARCAKVAADADLDMTLLPEDFDADWQRTLDASRRCADLFGDMQGMGDAMRRFQRYQAMTARLRARGHDPRAYIPWALVFRGPPGTGKTTVARKMAKIYHDMGFLSAPEVIECSVADLLSSYVAGSGKRVIRTFERALGKVLFIDEAYRLTEARAVDAIGEMVDCMTKERFMGKLVVVLAGYREDMDDLMRWNRGLRSRFATNVDFKPMTAEDSLELLQTHLAKVDIVLGGIEPGRDSWSRDMVLDVLGKLTRAKSWANGRDVIALSRIVVEEAYAGDESYPTNVRSVEGTDEKGDDGTIASKGEQVKIVFHADDLIPVLNRRLRRAREEDAEMTTSDAPGYARQGPGKGRGRSNAASGAARRHGVADRNSDHEDSDDERLDTSLAEARNPNEVVLHDYTSFIDFVPEEAMKRILFNISRHRPVNEEDERKLIGWLRNATNLAEATSRWGKGGMVAGALCLEAMLCLSRVFEGAARDDDGARQYLERAFQLAQQAVKAAPPDSADGAHARDVLSEVMFLVCTQGDDAEDDAQADARIEAAIRATKEARDAAAAASLDTERRAIAARLAELLKMRFERSETQEDLDEAIACATPLLDMPPEDDEDLPDTLHMLTELYAEKILHFRVATRDEMDAAVGYATDWLESVNDRSLRRMRTLILAGRLISWRFLRSRDGNIDELNRALEFQKEGLALAGPDATDRAWRSYRRELLGDTASMLVTRFRAEGSRADLEEAMRLAIQGRDMTGCSGPEWKCTLALLRARDAKYNLTLDEAELDMGLKEAEAVLHLDGLDKDAKASMFNVLCDAYTNRYRVSSNEEDINKAIEYGTEAAKLYPRELSFATSLGVAMILSYERTGKGSDFRKAMTRVAKVVQAGDGVHNGDLGHMVKASLLRIYRRSKKAVFLDYAVNTMQASVRKTPTHQSQYEMHVSDLAECLIQRYDSDKEKYADDLDHGIRVSEASLKLRVINAHYRSTTLENLGMLYQRKYEAMAPGARDEGTLRKAIHYFRLGWEHASADSAARIKCGRAAAQLLGIVGEWRAAADILTACVRMLPRVTGLASGDGNQQHVMKRYGGLASSCAEALMNANATAETDGDRDGEPTKHEEGEPAYGALAALRYLELGRSIISRLSLEQSAEVDLLRQHDAQLADAYLEARKKLYTFAGLPEDHQEDNSTTLSPIAAAKYKRRVRIEEEFEAVCRRIRGKPGLEHFLLPPQTAEMQAAARNGIIVVVNVGKQRSDAFLISNAGVKPKQLDGVDEESVATVKGQGMPVLMEWLWHHVASPILSAAAVPEVADGRWLRVWWVLTGPLTGVPIHAAGLGGGSNQDSVLDRVMSSYATSVMSLLYARRITKTIPSGPSDTTTSTSAGAQQQQHYQALLVSMGVTPGNKYGDLPQADNEVRAVEAQLHHGGRYSFQPVVAALADKTHAACLAALRSSSIFHFAGHAKVDQRVPSRSALLLTDHESEPLTMAAIRDDGSEETDQDRGTESGMLESPPRFLAYLSACSTGAVGDPSLADEAIHLVAGMQLARFRHVVGTLWEVADWYCVQIAVKFYRRLLHSDACQDGGDGILSDDGVCRALHEAIREVREGRFERTRRTRGEEGGQEHLDPLDTLDGPDGEAGLEAFPELGPSRFGIGVSPLEAPADSHLTRQWNATHIARWAPYVHYGV